MSFMHTSILAVLATSCAALLPVTLVNDGSTVTISNGFATMGFNLNRGSVDVLQGSFQGNGVFANINIAPSTSLDFTNYAPNTVQGAVSLVVIGNGSSYGETSTSSMTLSSPLRPTIISQTSQFCSFSVSMNDGALPGAPARVASLMTFSLGQADRGITVNVTSSTLPSASFSAAAITLRLWFSPDSAVVEYTTGVRQGSQVNSGFLASQVGWNRFIGIGRRGAVDVVPLTPATSSLGSIMWAGDWNGARSGVELVLGGVVRDNGWSDGIEYVTPTQFGPNAALPGVAFSLTPNNFAFPSSVVPSTGAPSQMNIDDQAAILSAAVGSPYSALHSYDYSPETRIAPCIGIGGNNCYGGLYNFFDPDSFLSVSALLYSFEPSVVAAGRGLVETNLKFLCPGNVPGQACEEGQMLHHFVESCNGNDPWCWCTTDPGAAADEVGFSMQAAIASANAEFRNASTRMGQGDTALNVCVTFEAISGAVQTGPNIFHLWASLRTAAVTGNMPWLASHMPKLRASLEFLLRRLEPDVNLFNVPGSLMIDTFIRNNYTLDTSSAMIMLLEKAADAEAALGNATGASALQSIASSVRAAIPTYLWAPSADHFCTQANAPSTKGGPVIPCARDFIDYDSNLLALAAGVVTGAQAEAVLARIDSGPCTHQHATWVSEKYYGSADCNGGNTGDSAISMGRISWLDALARRMVDTPASTAVLVDQILSPIQAEQAVNTWMYERYQCSAKPTHNNYYIEMPEIVSMILVEAKYGIDFTSFSTVTVNPMLGFTTFVFAPVAGSPEITYDATTGAFSAMLPYVTPGTRTFIVTRMPQGSYNISTGQSVPVGADGKLTFSASVGVGIAVTAQLQA